MKCRNRISKCGNESTECSGYCFECAEEIATELSSFGSSVPLVRSAWHASGCDCEAKPQDTRSRLLRTYGHTERTILEQHNALVHPDGSVCPDGCDAPAHPDGQDKLAELMGTPPKPLEEWLEHELRADGTRLNKLAGLMARREARDPRPISSELRCILHGLISNVHGSTAQRAAGFALSDYLHEFGGQTPSESAADAAVNSRLSHPFQKEDPS